MKEILVSSKKFFLFKDVLRLFHLSKKEALYLIEEGKIEVEQINGQLFISEDCLKNITSHKAVLSQSSKKSKSSQVSFVEKIFVAISWSFVGLCFLVGAAPFINNFFHNLAYSVSSTSVATKDILQKGDDYVVSSIQNTVQFYTPLFSDTKNAFILIPATVEMIGKNTQDFIETSTAKVYTVAQNVFKQEVEEKPKVAQAKNINLALVAETSKQGFWSGVIDTLSDIFTPLFIDNSVSSIVNNSQNKAEKQNKLVDESQKKSDDAVNGSVVVSEKVSVYTPVVYGISQNELDVALSKLRLELFTLNSATRTYLDTMRIAQASKQGERTGTSIRDSIENISGSTITNSSADLTDLSVDTDTLVVDTENDRVGISTSSPFATLSVDGSLALTGGLYDNSASQGGNGYVLQSTGSGVTWVATSSLGISAGGIGSVNSGAAGYFAYYDSNGTTVDDQNVLNISGSNIGIGTTTPYAKLSVVGQVVGEYFSATSTTATSTFMGAVGIGTTTPIGLLNIASTNNAKVVLTDTDASVDQKHWFLNSTNGFFNIGTTSDSFLNQKNIFSISGQNGNVSIGGSNYDRRLVVHIDTATFGPVIEWGNQNGYVGVLGNGSVLSGGANRVYLGYGSNETLSITSTGFVGIGTTSPYAKLSVVGQVVGEYFTATSTTATSTFMGTIGVGVNSEAYTSPLTLKSWYEGGPNLDAAWSLGYNNIINGLYNDQVVIGNSNIVDTYAGIIAGIGNQVSLGEDNIVFGQNNVTNGNTNTAIGFANNTGDGTYHLAVGFSNSLNSQAYQYAFGVSNSLTAENTFVAGSNSSVTANNALVFGRNITNNIASSVMIGPSDSAKMTILSSGNLGIGTTSPSTKLDVWGNFQISTSSTPILYADPSVSKVAIGTSTLTGALSVGAISNTQHGLYLDTSYSNSASGFSSYGGYFKNYLNSGTAGYAYGLYSEASAGGSDPDGAYGIYGKASGNYARAGVYGLSESSGSGLYGYSNSSTGYGVTAQQGNSSGFSIYALGGKNYFQNNVGIGTTTPYAKLSVVGSVVATDFHATSTTSGFKAANLLGGATNLTVDANGNIIRDPSDERLKENIETIIDPLTKIESLRGVTYYWKDKERFGYNQEVGMIAQEVEQVVPQVVSSGGEYKSLNIKNLVALLIEGVKALKEKVDHILAWFSGDTFSVQGEVCVDEVCVSKEEFKALLLDAKNNVIPQSDSSESEEQANSDTSEDQTDSEDNSQGDTTNTPVNEPPEGDNNQSEESGVLEDGITEDDAPEVIQETTPSEGIQPETPTENSQADTTSEVEPSSV